MQNNNTEIEIKLSCPQNFNDIFAKNLNNFGTFEVIKNKQINCLNTYFDTKNFDLKQQKTALRFRKMHNIKSNQNNYFLTIKGSNLIDNQRGLSNRKEFNLEVFTEKEVRDKLLRKLKENKEILTTEQIIENVKQEMNQDAEIYDREHKL